MFFKIKSPLILAVLAVFSTPALSNGEQVEFYQRTIADLIAKVENLEQRLPQMSSTTRRPGSYGHSQISIPKRTSGTDGVSMFKFGDTKLALISRRHVFVSGTVTFRPLNYGSNFVGAAISATKAGKTIVLHDSFSPDQSIQRGSGDGPYFRVRSDAYTTVPISGVIEIPEGGDWNFQFLIENTDPSGQSLVVHTYSLTVIAI